MANLSDTFKYISHFRHAGHQIGRKVGDMLEVLTYASLVRDEELLARLQVEPKLFGYSDAGHKVEFVILNNSNLDSEGNPLAINGGSITDPETIISFIECKKVGVEQTINGKFKKTYRKNGNNKNYIVPFNEELIVKFAPRGGTAHTYTVVFSEDLTVKVEKDGQEVLSDTISEDFRLIFTLCEQGDSSVIGNESSLRAYDSTLKNCRILEVYGSNEEGVLALLNDCLSGPQTPEKAKQSSFVALDVRKKRFNSFDKREDESDLVSVLVLTEFSHWEEKSQNMIKACIDKNLVVEDSIIVQAFEAFEAHFGADFYDKITKESLQNDENVRNIALNIVNSYDGKIYKDIEDGQMKRLSILDDKIVISS